ncbi:hypothetical protein MMC32_001107 [Xylographa parallela]|nr:hypothetical protein [Xylographa parallela]
MDMIKNRPSTSRIVPLCAAWFLPNDPQARTGRKVFAQRRIPGARFLDIDAVKDNDSPYPHMLPTAERFAQAMSELGLKRDDDLVVYDTQELGIFSAPRVAWMLRVFGHPKFHILNNFKLWVEQGYPTDTGEPLSEIQESTNYPVPTFDVDRVITFRGVRDIVKEQGREGSEGVQIIDARSAGRFSGSEPEPRPGLSSGHMPGSINLPLSEILDPKTKAFLPEEELRKVFQSKGLDPEKPIVTTCGTGVMAAALDTALQAAQFGARVDRRVYDGSWTEWAQRGSESDGLIEKS